MRVVTKVKSDELEIIKIYICSGFIITVEIFTVQDGYKSLASNNFVQHDSLLGNGFHPTKKGSVKLSVKDLYGLMLAFKD